MDEVETRYVRSAGGSIAYQVIGTTGVNVLVAKLGRTPVDLMWDLPSHARFLNGLSSFSRHVWFDVRGSGASDPIDLADGRLMESYVDDMLAVIDDLDLEQVVVLGLAGPPGALFAATHPERTTALVLVSPTARIRRDDDYPQGVDEDLLDERLSRIYERWGTGHFMLGLNPTLRDDRAFVRWAARCERLSLTPFDAEWRERVAFQADVRHVLDAIRVPTLVAYRPDAPLASQSRYVADHISGAKEFLLPGRDQFYAVGDTKPLLDAIEEFVTGSVVLREDDRVLATIMFTDVVGSTEQLVEHGDRHWQALLDSHDAVVRSQIERFRGREINTTGDGFVATFDGPGRAIRCARATRDALQAINVDVRIGLHTGEIERRGDDIGGIAVHIAQRIQALAEPGEVLASSTVKDLVAGSGITFTDRGTRTLKGVPDQWRVFTAEV